MSKKKKSVCFIAQYKVTCDFVARQLLQFLDKFITVRTWCLKYDSAPPGHFFDNDIFIVSCNTTMELVRGYFPPGKAVLLAARNINIKRLEKLLEFKPGTKALVVAGSAETAASAINLMNGFGVNYLELVPYYPGSSIEIPGDIELAITTGLSHIVPEQVKKIVDLGNKGIDLSTFANLMQHLNIPIEVLNEISHHYLEAILSVSHNRLKIARVNENLKHNMEVVLNTVNDAIIAVDGSNHIIMFNPTAEEILNIKKSEVMGKIAGDVIPQLDFTGCLKSGESILNEVKRINETHYVITINPIRNEPGLNNGVVATLRPVDEVQELETKVRRVLKKKGNVAKHTFADIIGESAELKKTIALAKKFAETELTVLLEGESGTGKELFAQAIHNQSSRRKGPFVALNFAALPENLVESELFGYEDGAFTGAKRGGRPGLFEEAHLGTIFLDEIGDSSPEVQKRLLRVLEEREIRRVGGSTVTPVDVRVIAATNQSLENLVKQGKFRADLFFRLCALPVSLPPLRSRDGDIILLVNYFSGKISGRQITLDASIKDFLQSYSWKGNIRELENVVKYMCSVLGLKQVAGLGDLPPYLMRKSSQLLDAANAEPVRRQAADRYKTLVSALKSEGSLDTVLIMLQEIQSCSLLNRGVGRNALMEKLKASRVPFSDYKVRQLLRMLNELGYIDSGVTRQGSRITALGEELLSFLESGQPHLGNDGIDKLYLL